VAEPISNTKKLIWNRALSRIGVTDLIEIETEDNINVDICGLHYGDLVIELLRARPWPWAMRDAVLAEISTQSDRFTSTTTPAVDGASTIFPLPYKIETSDRLTVTLIDSNGAETELTAADAPSEADNEYQFDPYLPDTGLGSNIVTHNYASGYEILVEIDISRTGWTYMYSLPADFVSAVGIVYGDAKYESLLADARMEYEMVMGLDGESIVFCIDVPPESMNAFKYVARAPEALFSRGFVDALAWRLASELATALKKDTGLADYCMNRYVVAMEQAHADDAKSNHIQWSMTPAEAARG
jgi:hypothetical protein